MRYIDVKWKQSDPRFPIRIYSEIDDDGWEQRKVETFMNGIFGYASKAETKGLTILGLEPVPSFSEIMNNPEFEVHELTVEEFEQVWSQAHAAA